MKVRFAAAVTAITAIILGLLVVSGTQTAMAAEERDGVLRTSGSQILDTEGEHTIKAVSWFGLETETCSPHGLWQVSLDSVLQSIKTAGFNTIRLPYANECLHRDTVTGVNASVNPTLVSMSPQQLMDTVITEADRYGLDIILDRHRPGVGGQSELWYTAQISEQQWINDWKMLANRYLNQTNVIGADLHNEPHGAACWGCGSPAYDWKAAAERAGNAVLAENPNLLIIVEGTEKNNSGTKTTWWGGGLWHAEQYPVQLSNPTKLVYSVHDYPSTIWNQSWFSDPNYPNNLISVWDENWGYLQKEGIAPVFVGEFGTKYETMSDKQWLSELVQYLDGNSMSWAFWAYNPNSGDTGGVVGNDWSTYETDKLSALSDILTPTGTTPTPTSTPTIIPDPTGTPTVAPTPSGTPTPQNPEPHPSESPTAPTTTPSPTSTPPTAPPVTNGNMTVQWKLQSGWDQGYVAEMTVTGEATTWQVSWTDPTATRIVNAWGMKCDLTGNTITCKGTDWATSVKPGQTHQVGLQVATSNGQYSKTPTLTVNGTQPAPPPVTTTPTVPPTPAAQANIQWKLQSGWDQGYVAEMTVTGEAGSWQVSWTDPTVTGIVNAWGIKCDLTGNTITCKGTDWVTSLKPGQKYQVGLQVTTSNGGYNRSPSLTITAK